MARLPVLLLALALALASPAGAATLDVAIGGKLFRRVWVGAPASTKAADGLGPLFSAASCVTCHPGGGSSNRMVTRLGNAGRGDPLYGRQLQAFSVAGLSGEEGWPLGALDPDTRLSRRRPPDLAAAGAIASLGSDAILAGEGRAGGRAGRLPDGRIGRFGWKATGASLPEQIAGAFSTDMGMSTSLFPDPHGDCMPADGACKAAPTGSERGEPEVADAILASLAEFVRSLAPAPPGPPGSETLARFGCTTCHVPVLRDAAGREARVFSDLLLHDLGAELDDGLAEGGAASSEWRTAPFPGLGRHLARGGRLMHDGRAGSIGEAIALHGGKAAFAREAFAAAPAADRAALETYLKGL
jgi:CxxC motif-containing protein (DUF1111 family)